ELYPTLLIGDDIRLDDQVGHLVETLFYYLQSIEHHSFLWGAKLRIFPQCFEGNLAFVNLRAIVKRTGIPIIMRIVSFIAAGLLIACGKSEKQPHAVEQAKWLIGSWENKNEI